MWKLKNIFIKKVNPEIVCMVYTQKKIIFMEELPEKTLHQWEKPKSEIAVCTRTLAKGF